MNKKSIAAERAQIRGVYQVKSADGSETLYVGSTSLQLEEVEHNHRAFREKKYSATDFRIALEADPTMVFSWALTPRTTSVQMIEVEESALIRYTQSKYNKKGTWGQYPWKASVQNERYNAEMVLL
jgi:hypothetical protein